VECYLSQQQHETDAPFGPNGGQWRKKNKLEKAQII
jgi:hypothetical protein